MDIIVVKDVPAAAVGEVKASWTNHNRVIQSYRQMVEDIQTLQEGRLVRNNCGFGAIGDDSTLAEMSRRLNQCYAFLIALGQGDCKVKHLEDDIKKSGIRPGNASVLVLDQDH